MRWRWMIPLLGIAAFAQEVEQPAFTFSVTSNLVIVNVEARDRQGNPLQNLTIDDFEVLEDGKKQKLSVFEYQELELAEDEAAPAPAPEGEQPAEEAAHKQRKAEITTSQPGQIRFRDRRLMILFFDFSSMPVADQIRAQKAAEKFLREKMTSADLVGIMTFGAELRVAQDFTDDRDLLLGIVKSFRAGETSELSEMAAEGEEDTGEDTGAAFTADESEFNIFNTDRKLSALETATKMLATLPEKKALVYFSSGVGKTGSENESQLRATVNAAVRSNVAFYPIDARGLVAEAPLGDTRKGGTRGSSMYSGSAQRQRQSSFMDQQETLYTLAADTGGKALLDSNDLSLGIVQAQRDISSYYILGYYSTNMKENGRYRRLKVGVKDEPKAKLAYRSGYFANKSFKQFSDADRERQLEEAILLGDPITDLPLVLEVNYFLRGRGRYVVPVAVKIPGSEITLARRRNSEETRLDFIAQVRDERGRLMGAVRDFIKVKLTGENVERLNGRHLQYDTAFTLPPGKYDLKFLARENEIGKIGTFETKFEIPDLNSEDKELNLSSVVWANQRESVDAAVGSVGRDKRGMRAHPLVNDDQKLIPSITRVFRTNQSMYVMLEIYNAGQLPGVKTPSVAATVSLYRGKIKAFESEPIRLKEKPEDKSGILRIEAEVPLDDLEVGRYTCQVNIIDEAGRKFAFRRAPLVILPPRETGRQEMAGL